MHVFYSPHYDDAVYSCGGTMYQLAQRGDDVLMVTVMAGTPQTPFPDTPVLQDNHQRWQVDADINPMQMRRTEDQNAASILGVDTIYADILDCLYRTQQGQALYPTETSLWGAVAADDPAVQQLDELPFNWSQMTRIYAPLAVGNHVDHQVVRDWALTLQRLQPDVSVWFYEDYPYLRQPERIADARAQITDELQPEPVTLSDAAMQAKIDAMRAYRSQISSFWDDAATIADDVRTTFTDAAMNTYVERYWRLKST